MYSQYDGLPDRIPRINSHIAAYLRNPTPTWLAVQKAKSAGVRLVYYYEPADQYIHFASNGIPVHDQHYFDAEAPFFAGEDEAAAPLQNLVKLPQCGDEDIGAEKVEGKAGMVRPVVVDLETQEGSIGEGDTCASLAYDPVWDLYQPFGMLERFDKDWKSGVHDGDFVLMPVLSITEEEDMSEAGVWLEEWDFFFFQDEKSRG